MPEGLHTAAVYCSAWPGVGFQCRCMLRPERLLAQRGQVDGPYGLSEPLRLVLGQLCQQALGQLADAGVDELAGLESVPVVQPPDHSGRLLDAQDVADAFDPTDDPVAGQSFLVGGRPLCPGTRHIPERDLRAVSVKEQPCGFPWQHGASAGDERHARVALVARRLLASPPLLKHLRPFAFSLAVPAIEHVILAQVALFQRLRSSWPSKSRRSRAAFERVDAAFLSAERNGY